MLGGIVIMKIKAVLIIAIMGILVGCGKDYATIKEEDTNIDITEEETEEEQTSDQMEMLLDECTAITLWYEYKMNEGGHGPVYKLSVRGEVAEFSVLDNIESKRDDYVIEKFDELKKIVRETNPKLYDINEHADENGKIIYETLNPAVELYVPGEGYFLDIEDTTTIETFFNELLKSSGFNNNDELETEVISTRQNSDDISKNVENNVTSESECMAVAKTGGLRVKSEANTDAEVIAQLTEGQTVPILDNTENDEWIKVDINGDEGYVLSEYVTVVYPESKKIASEKTYGINVGDTLTISKTTNIRSKMDTSSAKVAVAYSGDTLTILNIENGWALVEYKNKQGYIRVDLLTR